MRRRRRRRSSTEFLSHNCELRQRSQRSFIDGDRVQVADLLTETRAEPFLLPYLPGGVSPARRVLGIRPIMCVVADRFLALPPIIGFSTAGHVITHVHT